MTDIKKQQDPCLVAVKKVGHVAHITLSRPDKRNAMNEAMCQQLKSAFESVNTDDVRCVVLSGEGKMFCAGMDVNFLMGGAAKGKDPARASLAVQGTIKRLHSYLQPVADCRVPVIAAVHGMCIGGGVDLISFTDIRIASSDAVFSIKEVDMGIVPDIGTLQRFPIMTGNHSLLSELAFTGRRFTAAEALQAGIIGTVVKDNDPVQAALKMAAVIAEKSPVTVVGIKEMLHHAHRGAMESSMRHVRLLNSALLQTGDVRTAMKASMANSKPKYSKL